MIVAGIDIGSTTTKVVFLDAEGKVRASALRLTAFKPEQAGLTAIDECCRQCGIGRDDIAFSVATGYGRELLEFADAQVTEITCHARGAHTCFPEARSIIDMGGQDSKAISIDGSGHVVNFVMNDKCAAGTGRFFDLTATTLGIEPAEMGRLSLQSKNAVKVSSVCAVFAESEVITLVSKRVDPIDIIAGIHHAAASRVCGLIRRAQIAPPIVMTGGVAKNVGVVKAFEDILNTKLLIPDEPQIIGALGAAHIALQRYLKKR